MGDELRSRCIAGGVPVGISGKSSAVRIGKQVVHMTDFENVTGEIIMLLASASAKSL